MFNLQYSKTEMSSQCSTTVVRKGWHPAKRQKDLLPGLEQVEVLQDRQRQETGQAAISPTPDTDGSHAHTFEHLQLEGAYVGDLLLYSYIGVNAPNYEFRWGHDSVNGRKPATYKQFSLEASSFSEFLRLLELKQKVRAHLLWLIRSQAFPSCFKALLVCPDTERAGGQHVPEATTTSKTQIQTLERL